MILNTKELAHASLSDSGFAVSINRTLNLHLTLSFYMTLSVLCISTIGLSFSTGFGAVALGLFITSIQYLFAYSSVYRIATRSDYINSIFQAASNLLMISLLILSSIKLGAIGLYFAVFVYFGLPMLSEFFSFFTIGISSSTVSTCARIRTFEFINTFARAAPVALGPLSDYLKIYLSSLILHIISNTTTYNTFSTSILIVARLINPLTLLTKPLLPAYIDALNKSDFRWINRIMRLFLYFSIFGLFFSIAIPQLLFMAPQLIELRKQFPGVTSLFILSSSLFGYFYLLLVLMSPFYIARGEIKVYGLYNLLTSVASLLLGTLLAVEFGAQGMMCGVASFSGICALVLIRRLFKTVSLTEEVVSK